MTTPTPIRAARGRRTHVQPAVATIHLQLYPGMQGRAERRGIGGIPFTVKVGSVEVQSENVGRDGSIPLRVPLDTTECTLRVLDADYHIYLAPVSADLQAVAPPAVDMRLIEYADASDPAFPTYAHVLGGLGYMPPVESGQTYPNTVSAELDRALLDFQTNEGLYPSGVAFGGVVTEPLRPFFGTSDLLGERNG